MADNITVQVNGISSVLGKLGALDAKVAVGVLDAIIQGAQQCYQDSQDTVPVDTGALKASGQLAFAKLQATVSYGEGLDPNYAWYQELGTSKMSAQPFLYPAFLNAVTKITADLHNILEI